MASKRVCPNSSARCATERAARRRVREEFSLDAEVAATEALYEELLPADGARVDYVLPSSEWKVLVSGVWWPGDGPASETAATASRHRLVWVDVVLP
mgnify:CR=1 FL=1